MVRGACVRKAAGKDENDLEVSQDSTIIAFFKNKANIRRNETKLNNQKAKQSEKHIGLHQEEHRESVP